MWIYNDNLQCFHLWGATKLSGIFKCFHWSSLSFYFLGLKNKFLGVMKNPNILLFLKLHKIIKGTLFKRRSCYRMQMMHLTAATSYMHVPTGGQTLRLSWYFARWATPTTSELHSSQRSYYFWGALSTYERHGRLMYVFHVKPDHLSIAKNWPWIFQGMAVSSSIRLYMAFQTILFQ
jgi:hypothetical protein